MTTSIYQTLETPHRTTRPQRRPTQPVFDEAAIASLSHDEIAQKSRQELIAIIRASRLPTFQPSLEPHLDFYDCRTLQRLAHLARRCCRNRGY